MGVLLVFVIVLIGMPLHAHISNLKNHIAALKNAYNRLQYKVDLYEKYGHNRKPATTNSRSNVIPFRGKKQ